MHQAPMKKKTTTKIKQHARPCHQAREHSGSILRKKTSHKVPSSPLSSIYAVYSASARLLAPLLSHSRALLAPRPFTFPFPCSSHSTPPSSAERCHLSAPFPAAEGTCRHGNGWGIAGVARVRGSDEGHEVTGGAETGEKGGKNNVEHE